MMKIKSSFFVLPREHFDFFSRPQWTIRPKCFVIKKYNSNIMIDYLKPYIFIIVYTLLMLIKALELLAGSWCGWIPTLMLVFPNNTTENWSDFDLFEKIKYTTFLIRLLEGSPPPFQQENAGM